MKSIAILFGILALFVFEHSEAGSMQFGPFGSVTLYGPTRSPSAVVLFVSGDEGWNQGVVDMAQEIAKQNALVAGIDAAHYLRILRNSKSACAYPASDFEALSKFIQKSLNLPHYIPPVLAGYSSGATLVYATIVQSPPNTFAGAVTLGFCPDLQIARKFCKGYGLESKTESLGHGIVFLPATEIHAPWIAIQGQVDRTCGPKAIDSYIKNVKTADVIWLPGVGHGFSTPEKWMPQLHDTFSRLLRHRETVEQKQRDLRPVEVKDLPLVEVEAQNGSPDKPLAVIVTGDGGWASIDRDIGNALAERGIPVVGFNSLQYFWSRHTPDETARDVQRVLQHYLTLWHKQKAIMIGYSFGADVLPFLINRFPQGLQQPITAVALLGPSRTADFEFHLTDWLGGVHHENDKPVLPEIKKMQQKKILCLYGEDETDSICRELKGPQFRPLPIPGGHHFGGAFRSLADLILKE